MALLKKVKPDWSPSENRGLKVGEVIEIGDYRRLVQSGVAILVDEKGSELALPGQVFVCPICFSKTESHVDFIAHVNTHNTVSVKSEPAPMIPEEESVISAQPEPVGDTVSKEQPKKEAKDK